MAVLSLPTKSSTTGKQRKSAIITECLICLIWFQARAWAAVPALWRCTSEPELDLECSGPEVWEDKIIRLDQYQTRKWEYDQLAGLRKQVQIVDAIRQRGSDERPWKSEIRKAKGIPSKSKHGLTLDRPYGAVTSAELQYVVVRIIWPKTASESVAARAVLEHYLV